MEQKFKPTATVDEVAKALKRDANTVRYMIKNNLVPWGFCFKTDERNKRTVYVINPKQFYETTGIML